jgi:hypothetical protein
LRAIAAIVHNMLERLAICKIATDAVQATYRPEAEGLAVAPRKRLPQLSSPRQSDPGLVTINKFNAGSLERATNSSQIVDRRNPSALFKVADGALAQI